MQIEARTITWTLREPFTISRGTMTTIDGILVTLSDAGHMGRGEAYGIIYEHDTPASMLAQIAAIRSEVENGITREALYSILPFGGARCAIDCALWDVEAKRSGIPAWQTAGLDSLRPIVTAFTIGMRPAAQVELAARAHAEFDLLKIKVDARDPLTTLRAARAGAPKARFIVDPNQSWSFGQLVALTPQLQALGVALLEQPLPIDADDAQAGYASPIPICADELIHDRSDLPKARGKYSHINIKLDKTGGLTEALALAQAARAEGFGLMVGCMAGSSLAMAPAALIGQLCDFVDLDGPLLQIDDWDAAMACRNGVLDPPGPALWG
jgi:L-Ala-D/L-Glu epimerase